MKGVFKEEDTGTYWSRGVFFSYFFANMRSRVGLHVRAQTVRWSAVSIPQWMLPFCIITGIGVTYACGISRFTPTRDRLSAFNNLLPWTHHPLSCTCD